MILILKNTFTHQLLTVNIQFPDGIHHFIQAVPHRLRVIILLLSCKQKVKTQMKQILTGLCQQDILIIPEIIHHLDNPLCYSPRLKRCLHNSADTETVILLHQLKILLQVSLHQAGAVIDFPFFRPVYHFQRLKAVNTWKTLSFQAVFP